MSLLDVKWHEPDFEREHMCDTRFGECEVDGLTVYLKLIPLWPFGDEGWNYMANIHVGSKSSDKTLATTVYMKTNEESQVMERATDAGAELVALLRLWTSDDWSSKR